MLALTIDIEWSPDPIVDECVELIEKRQAEATFYCTDPSTDTSGQSSSLRGRYSDRCELALHPNLDHRGDYDAVFESLRAFYPDAAGFRSHNCSNGWKITLEAFKRGMIYESNYLIYGRPLTPFLVHESNIRFWQAPVYCMDAAKLSDPAFGWSIVTEEFRRLCEDPDLLLVFDFHPIMLYYDTSSFADYEAAKVHYHKPKPELSFRRKDRLQGSMKLYQELLGEIDRACFTTVERHVRRLDRGLAPREWVVTHA